MKVGANTASVLRELAITIKTMTKSNKLDTLVIEMSNTSQELQNLLKPYPNTHNKNGTEVPYDDDDDDEKIEIPIMEIIQVVTVVSLLNEIVVRVKDIVKCVEELSNLAKFEPSILSKCNKSKQHLADNKISPEQQNDEETIIKTIQIV